MNGTYPTDPFVICVDNMFCSVQLLAIAVPLQSYEGLHMNAYVFFRVCEINGEKKIMHCTVGCLKRIKRDSCIEKHSLCLRRV